MMPNVAIALLGAFAGGLLTYLATLKSIYNSSVIQERQKWRNTIRCLAIDLADALDRVNTADNENADEIGRLRRELKIRLNPADEEDNKIINASTADELADRVAILLKHDWERAKLESRIISPWLKTANRPDYNERGRVSPDAFVGRAKVRRLAGWTSLLLLLILPMIIRDYIAPFMDSWVEAWREI